MTDIAGCINGHPSAQKIKRLPGKAGNSLAGLYDDLLGGSAHYIAALRLEWRHPLPGTSTLSN